MVSKLSSVFRSLVGSDGPSTHRGPRKRALESDPDDVEVDVLESPQVKRAKSSHREDSSSPSRISSPSVALEKFASWIKVTSTSFVDSYFFRHREDAHIAPDRGSHAGRHQSRDALTRRPLHGSQSEAPVTSMFSTGSAVNKGQRPNNPQQSRISSHKDSNVKGNQQRQKQHQQRGNYNSGLPPGARHKTTHTQSSDVIMVNGNGHGEDEEDGEDVHHQYQFKAPRDVGRNKTSQRQHTSTNPTPHRGQIPRSTQTIDIRSKPAYKTQEYHQVSKSYQPVNEKLFPQQRPSPGRGQRTRHNSTRLSTANECVRLNEKQRYHDLLKQFTSSTRYNMPSSSSSSVLSSSTQVRNVMEPPRVHHKPPPLQQQFTTDIGSLVRKPIVRHPEPAVPGSRILPHQYNSKREIREAARQRLHVPVSELSPKASPMVTDRPLAPTPAQPDFSCDSRPESPVITAFKPPSRCESRGVSPMTVFERSLRDSPYALEDWVKNMKDKFESSRRLKNRQVEEQETRVKLHEERRLKEQTKLIDRIREQMTISEKQRAVIEDHPIIIDDEVEEEEEEEEIEELEEEEEELAELTPEMEDEIDAALVPNPPDETLLEGFKLLITRHDIQTLNGLNWLNDEVINFYMQLIMARSQQDGYPNVHCFNTFFYPKLLKGGQPSLRRWTKRVDIFAKDLIVVPVHLGMHWCMAIIDFRSKSITYYDSMGSHNRKCLESLREYLRAEHQDKKGSPYDLSGWSCMSAKDIPQQLNGSDCGMFTCKFAEYITRDAQITFTQHDMPYFRRRMIWEILHMKLL